MRFLFGTVSMLRASILGASLLCVSAAWGQNGRDCAAAASVSDKAICSNATLKMLDQQASMLWEDLWAHNLISQPEYNQLRAAWDREAEACGKEPAARACLQRRLEARTVFIRSERIAQGLDRLPANARQDLAKLSAEALNGLKTINLLKVQPVVAPLAASVIGREWLSWAESDLGVPGDDVEVEPDGRWVIARGWLFSNSLHREIWVAIDKVDCQLWIVRLEQLIEQEEPEIRWASTSPGWPATVAKLFKEQGLNWDAPLLRQVGLAATRVRK